MNNASVRYDHPQYFALVPHQRVWQILNANISAVTTMTHMLLPKMLQRRKGAIINVCSIAACTPPIPLTAEYTASMVRLGLGLGLGVGLGLGIGLGIGLGMGLGLGLGLGLVLG